jgi:hypothetical protein
MISSKETDKPGLMKGILMAYFVLALHVLLVAGLGVLVIFFRGIVNYMIWIFLFGSAAVLTSAFLFYRRMKKEQKTLGDMLNSPMFRGRSVEVSFLGGLASFKIGNSGNTPMMLDDSTGRLKQIEDPETLRIKELKDLARLFENDLITLDEFSKAKNRLLNS